MKRLVACFLVLSVSILGGYLILTLWRGVSLYLGIPSEENLLRATRFTPLNPNPYYRLGLYYQLSIEGRDLNQSLHYLKEAIERDPFDQRYWLTLAKALSRMGETKSSEAAIERALFVFPTGYTGRWTAANLFLQQDDFEKALLHFSYILANYPDRSNMVYEVLFRTGQDPDFILDRVVPANPSSFNQYLSYLYEIGDRQAATEAWARKVSLGYRSDRAETLRHIDFLISGGALNEASRVWGSRLKEEGLPVPSDGNLITNGDFEREKMLGGGFDWKIIPAPGVSILFDPSVVFSGKKSLKIRFDGKGNVDFHHVYQFVSWEPNKDYLLRAEMKTQGLTTKSGIKMEVVGVGPGLQAASEPLTGDNGWRDVTIAFHTPGQSQGGIVRLRRERTDKFDRFISGSAWLDNVQLTEKR
jgi:hypothetical protein